MDEILNITDCEENVPFWTSDGKMHAKDVRKVCITRDVSVRIEARL